MAVFEVAEGMVLLIAVLGFIPALMDIRTSRKLTSFFWGYVLIIIGLAATTMEAFHEAAWWNIVEH
ncbi:MAG: hypothetical protein AABY11_02645, partial [archaeon]